MDIRLMIKKSTSLIITLTLSITSISIMLYYIRPLSYVQQLFIAAPLITFWLIYGQKVQEFIVTGIKHKVIKGYYKSGKLLNTISDALSNEQNKETIFKIIEKTLDDTIKFDQIGFILAIRDHRNDTLLKYTFFEAETIEKTDYRIEDIPVNSPIISFFENSTQVTSFQDLDDASKKVFKELNYEEKALFLPLTSPEMLEGIILLGQRAGDIAYSKKDLSCFKQLINLINVFLYKLTPYEKIEQAFNENQRQLYEAQNSKGGTFRLQTIPLPPSLLHA